MATQKQQGIKKRLTKGFTKVAVIGAVAAIIGIGALLIAAAQYEKALNRYGFTQGDIGKAMTAFSESRSCLLYTSPSPRDAHESRMPSSA